MKFFPASIVAGPVIIGLLVFVPGMTSPATAAVFNAGTAPTITLPVQIAQAPASRRNLVQRVQVMLTRLGYDPGPADGVMGSLTVRSVQAFQKRAGLAADGRVSEALYLALLASVEKAARSTTKEKPPVSTTPATQTVAVSPPIVAAPTALPATISFANSSWVIQDSTGARSSLKLLDEGKVSGVESPRFWRWQPSDDGIRITYDNKLGGWVTRRGRITGDSELSGDAKSSRGIIWTWTARRKK